MKTTTGIVWVGPVGDIGGYGNVSRNLVKSISKLGIPLSIINTSVGFDPEIGIWDLEFLQSINQPINKMGAAPILIIHGEPTEFVHYFGINSSFRKYIGVTIFETDKIPDSWVEPCNMMDEIWVPSEFNLETFKNSGVKPEKLKLVPYPIDVDKFNNSFPNFDFHTEIKSFKFLYTCAFDYRKGIDLLVNAYSNEFDSFNNVTLILKIYVPGWMRDVNIFEEINSYIPKKDNNPHIVLIVDRLLDNQLYSLYQSCDCYISTDRANGWGMPCMEVMAMGKPAITVNWSGATQFMNENNSFLIFTEQDFEPVHPSLQLYRPELYSGHNWPKINITQVQKVMRIAYENVEAREIKAKNARNSIRSEYSLNEVARRYILPLLYIDF